MPNRQPNPSHQPQFPKPTKILFKNISNETPLTPQSLHYKSKENLVILPSKLTSDTSVKNSTRLICRPSLHLIVKSSLI